MTHYLMDAADEIIVEINAAQPEVLRICMTSTSRQQRPTRSRSRWSRTNQRIGRVGNPG